MKAEAPIFVLGTGAEVGKTLVASGIITALNARGLPTLGIRPIETGCAYDDEHELVGHDGVRLRAATPIEVPPLVASPYRFAPAISPALAADRTGLELTLDDLAQTVHTARTFGRVVVEGPGGPLSPLTTDSATVDLADLLRGPIIVVAQDRRGADADVLSTLEACDRRGLVPRGIVLSRHEADHTPWSNEESVRARTDIPIFSALPHLEDASSKRIAEHLESTGAIDALLA